MYVCIYIVVTYMYNCYIAIVVVCIVVVCIVVVCMCVCMLGEHLVQALHAFCDTPSLCDKIDNDMIWLIA